MSLVRCAKFIQCNIRVPVIIPIAQTKNKHKRTYVKGIISNYLKKQVIFLLHKRFHLFYSVMVLHATVEPHLKFCTL